MKNVNKMKCIKVERKRVENGKVVNTVTDFIDFETFQKSFVKERWSGERRTQKQYTFFGEVHTRTTVRFDEKSKSVRDFTFPKSVAEAEKIDSER